MEDFAWSRASFVVIVAEIEGLRRESALGLFSGKDWKLNGHPGAKNKKNEKHGGLKLALLLAKKKKKRFFFFPRDARAAAGAALRRIVGSFNDCSFLVFFDQRASA